MKDLMKDKNLFLTDCVYYSAAGEGPFCPVCYSEKDNKLTKMDKKKSKLFESYFLECTDPDCQMKIFPSS